MAFKKVKDLTIEEVAKICKKHNYCYDCPLVGRACIHGTPDEIKLDEGVDVDE